MRDKPTPTPVTVLALREIDQISTIEELKKSKGYMPASEAHRLIGIGQRRCLSSRGSW